MSACADTEILNELKKSVKNSNSRNFHAAVKRAKTELTDIDGAISNNLWMFAGVFLQDDSRQFFLKHQPLWEQFFQTTPLTRSIGSVMALGHYTKALIESNTDFDKLIPHFDMLFDHYLSRQHDLDYQHIPQHLDPLLKFGQSYGQERDEYIHNALERLGSGVLQKLASKDTSLAFMSTTHLILKYAPSHFVSSKDTWAPKLLDHPKTQELVAALTAQEQHRVLEEEIGNAGQSSLKMRKI